MNINIFLKKKKKKKKKKFKYRYLNLDTDGNGMISRSEISKFCSGVYSEIFLDRVFEEFPTYNDEMVIYKQNKIIISIFNN